MNQLLTMLARDSVEIVQRSMVPAIVSSSADAKNLQDDGYLFFPDTGLFSHAVNVDGETVEVAMIGMEGILASTLQSGLPTLTHNILLSKSSGCKISVDSLTEIQTGCSPLRDLTNRFFYLLMQQVAQSIYCHARHSILERTAKWLTMASLLSGEDVFSIKQHSLALLLGNARPGTNIALNSMRRQGFIEPIRSAIEILDLNGVESLSCGCQREYFRMYKAIMGFEIHAKRVYLVR